MTLVSGGTSSYQCWTWGRSTGWRTRWSCVWTPSTTKLHFMISKIGSCARKRNCEPQLSKLPRLQNRLGKFFPKANSTNVQKNIQCSQPVLIICWFQFCVWLCLCLFLATTYICIFFVGTVLCVFSSCTNSVFKSYVTKTSENRFLYQFYSLDICAFWDNRSSAGGKHCSTLICYSRI